MRWSFASQLLIAVAVFTPVGPSIGLAEVAPSPTYSKVTAISWGYDSSGTIYYLTKFTLPAEKKPPPERFVVQIQEPNSGPMRFVLHSYSALTHTASVIDTLDLGYLENHYPETGSIYRTSTGFFLRVPSMSWMNVFVFPNGGQPKEVARYEIPCLSTSARQAFWYVEKDELLVRLRTEVRPDGIQVEKWMIGIDGRLIEEDWFALADSAVAGLLHRSSDIAVPLRDGSILHALLDYGLANLPAEVNQSAKGVVSWVIDAVNCVVRDYGVTPFTSIETTHAHLPINLSSAEAIHQSSGNVLVSIVEFPQLADVMSWDGTADVHVFHFDELGRPVLKEQDNFERGAAVVDTTYFIREVFRTDTQEHDLWIYHVDGRGNVTGRSINADAWQ